MVVRALALLLLRPRAMRAGWTREFSRIVKGVSFPSNLRPKKRSIFMPSKEREIKDEFRGKRKKQDKTESIHITRRPSVVQSPYPRLRISIPANPAKPRPTVRDACTVAFADVRPI